MAAVYFDSSALVKLLVDEPGADLVAILWHGADALLSSRLAYPEVLAALAAAMRAGRLESSSHQRAVAEWSGFWRAIRPVELTAEVAVDAGSLAHARALSGADAVHLASVLRCGDDVVVATWDRRLHDGALALGLPVVPAVID